MRQYKFGDIVLIKWRDSTHMDGWQTSRSVTNMDMITCKTVGMFHSQDKLMFKVCPTVADNEDVLGPVAIPQGCITKITRLRDK